MKMLKPNVIERLTIVAPLGLRFCDVATGSFVGEGLKVDAFLKSNTKISTEAFPNRSGVFVLHHVKGLKNFREFINGAGNEDFWKNFPPQTDYVIRVVDEMRRFQPFLLNVKLPVRGLYKFDVPVSSPLSPVSTIEANEQGVPLFSTSARTAPQGSAVVRADLWDSVNDHPASWVVLEAYLKGELIASGVADDMGRVALMFPYPKLQHAPVSSSSPPGSPLSPPELQNSSLLNQVWTLELKAKYEPFQTNETDSDLTSIPELRRTLTQREASIWEDENKTIILKEVSLAFGSELIVKTRSESSPITTAYKSVLLISPAISPP